MKFRAILLILSFLCVTSIVSAAPLLPTEFYGTVYIDGSPAPAGTTIAALVNNEVTGTITTSEPGIFGGYGPLDPRLATMGTTDGQEVTFTVNGIEAHETAAFHPGTTGELTVSTGSAPVVTPTSGATPAPTSGTSPAPTQKPVIDDVNYAADDDYNEPIGASQAGLLAQAQAPAPAKQPSAAPVTREAASGSIPSGVQPVGEVPGSQSPTTVSQASETSGLLPVYAIAGLVVLVVVFVGYSVYRRYTRWQ